MEFAKVGQIGEKITTFNGTVSKTSGSTVYALEKADEPKSLNFFFVAFYLF